MAVANCRPLFFVALYEAKWRAAAFPSCWDCTVRRDSRAEGNHPSLHIAVERSTAAGLGIVGNISLGAAVFTQVQALRLLESAWDRRGMFVEHIFKAGSFYFIYSIILCSVSVAWFFYSVYYDDYSPGTRIQCIPTRRFVVWLESENHKTLNSILCFKYLHSKHRQLIFENVQISITLFSTLCLNVLYSFVNF